MTYHEAMTPEERAEFDELMYEAGRPDGSPLPSGEIGRRVREALVSADQAGRPWAQWLLDDYTESGCLSAWKQWNGRQEKTQVYYEGALVRKPAVRAVQRVKADTGQSYYQQTFWDELSADDLRELVAKANARIKAERVTIAAALRLIAAIDQTGAATVREAMESLGTTVDEYLAAEAAT